MADAPLVARVNGQPWPFEPGATLWTVVETLELTGKRFAVEHNQRVVSRALLPSTTVADGDVVEIVTFVGGG